MQAIMFQTAQLTTNYFLLRVFEEAMIVRILMKMLIVSMYIPMDLKEKGTNVFVVN